MSWACFYSESNWFETLAWVYKNFDYMIGVSFLPLDTGTYRQAPYTAIDKEGYDQMVKEMPKVDWDMLATYEREDATSGSQEFACVGTSCEI